LADFGRRRVIEAATIRQCRNFEKRFVAEQRGCLSIPTPQETLIDVVPAEENVSDGLMSSQTE